MPDDIEVGCQVVVDIMVAADMVVVVAEDTDLTVDKLKTISEKVFDYQNNGSTWKSIGRRRSRWLNINALWLRWRR